MEASAQPPVSSYPRVDAADLWWDPEESGWGMQLVQSNNLLFATLFLYGQDRKPYWTTALLEYQGVGDLGSTYLFSGPVYETNGPWFGGAFDPRAVTVRTVGTMTFHLRIGEEDGFLEYSINGVNVIKPVRRQTLRNVELAPRYNAYRTVTAANCSNPADSYTLGTDVQLTTAQTSEVLSLTWSVNFISCTFYGPYVQTGRLGSLTGTFSCSTGETGTVQVSELAVGKGTLTGSWVAQSDTLGCSYQGRFAAIDVSAP
jgi:hypothetical protein